MIKYENREVEVVNGYTRVINEGTPLDGKYFFRKKEYQKVFDKLRNQLYIEDYWRDSFGNFHFRLMNGCEQVCSRSDIKKMAYETDELHE